jgi:DNA-binding transcriptional regulator PaaX
MFDQHDKKSRIKVSTKDILQFLGIGGVLIAAVIAPNAVQAFGFLLKDKEYVSWEKFNKSRVRQYVGQMEKQNLIKRSIKNSQRCYILTDKGRRFVLKQDINKLQLNRPKKWDGRWRVVIFDIPERKKVARDALRQKFTKLGMFQLQKSVFVYPFDCKKEVDFVSDYFDVANDILYLEARVYEAEKQLRNFFNL